MKDVYFLSWEAELDEPSPTPWSLMLTRGMVLFYSLLSLLVEDNSRIKKMFLKSGGEILLNHRILILLPIFFNSLRIYVTNPQPSYSNDKDRKHLQIQPFKSEWLVSIIQMVRNGFLESKDAVAVAHRQPVQSGSLRNLEAPVLRIVWCSSYSSKLGHQEKKKKLLSVGFGCDSPHISLYKISSYIYMFI